MTSINVSLPAALEDYVKGQVESGDWSTPGDYIRELIRQDKERRLAALEEELTAAARGARVRVPIAKIRRVGIVAALRERAHRRTNSCYH